MISLLLAMLGARRAQALTIFLLSIVATAAAVAGPAALHAVDQALVRNEVARATTAERSLSLADRRSDPSNRQSSARFDSVAGLLAMHGFEVVRGGELLAFAPVAAGSAVDHRDATTRIVFRERVCEHLVIVAGRCFAGALEVVLGETLAKHTGLRPGDTTTVQSARRPPMGTGMVPDGPPIVLSVVGIYRPADPDELYWGTHYYFPIGADKPVDEPVLLSVQTFDLVPHTVGANFADAIATPEAFAVDRIDDLPARVTALTGPDGRRAPDIALRTEIPALVERIQHGRGLAGQLVPVAFLPLVGLCLFVLFLAVSYGLAGRRHEIGLVALRGTSASRRWWLALAETTVVTVAGAPVGYVCGYVLVGLVASMAFGSTQGIGVDLSALPHAVGVLIATLVVAVLGQRRTITAPVVDLLRGVPRKAAAWRSFAIEGSLVALAALGVVQLRSASTAFVGVGLLVPGLMLVAVALVASRLFIPAAGFVARYALRAGHLGAGLAAIQIARRPGSQRLFALLAVALALLTFVAAGTGVAARGREDRAQILVGASAVLAVGRADAARLLAATHRADPDGAWAMAVLPVLAAEPDRPGVLAVDSARLATVANWRNHTGVSAQDVAAALAAPTARPMLLRGELFTVDIERAPTESSVHAPEPVQLALAFESLQDGSRVESVIGVDEGRRTYQGRAAGCRDGCRLSALTVAATGGQRVGLTVRALRATAGADIASPAVLSDESRWRGRLGTVVTAGTDGLTIDSDPGPFTVDAGASVATVDMPEPLRVVSTRTDPPPIGHPGNGFVTLTVAATVAILPRLGTSGSLVDLDYLNRVGLLAGVESAGEIWLGRNAPADAVARLRAAGLSVREVDSVAEARRDLDEAGPALALRLFLVAAALGVLLALGGLGLVASVDRQRRADDLRVLRVQGLPRRFVWRAALWGYLWLVVGAAVCGLVAGAAGWYATGARLPVFTDTVAALPPPRWPEPAVVLVPWAVATAAGPLRATVRTLTRKG